MMVTLDVLIEILSRLSPESLLCFKCVSKFWYALINDPKFVAKHLSNSLQQKHLLFKRHVIKNSIEENFVYSIIKFPLDRSLSISDVHFPFHEDYKFIHFHGHAHGLICVSGHGDTFLCNLATRQFRKLPTPIVSLDEIQNKPPEDYSSRTLISSVTGFGYDARSKDFKVVNVMLYVNENFSSEPLHRVEIYDMSKDRWREIEPFFWDGTILTPKFNIYHKGKIYWLGSCRMDEIILTFDICHEGFSQIYLPESFDWDKGRGSLGILNGSIVLFNYPFRCVDEKIFDIWEMKEDESGTILWSKLLMIGPNSRIEFPMMFVSSDELLIECKKKEVIVYNIKTQQFIELPTEEYQGIIRNYNQCEASFFVKSLLSVEGGNNVKYEF